MNELDRIQALQKTKKTPEPAGNLHSLIKTNPNLRSWLRRLPHQPENSEVLAIFNRLNAPHPPAQRLTVTRLSGTSFRRETVAELVERILKGEHSGKVELMACPYVDPLNPERNDPYAIKVIAQAETDTPPLPEDGHIGYIPKENGINKSYHNALPKLCGAHIIDVYRIPDKDDNPLPIYSVKLCTGWI